MTTSNTATATNNAAATATNNAAALKAAVLAAKPLETEPKAAETKTETLAVSEMEKAAKKKAEAASKRQAAEPKPIKRTLEETLKELAQKQELNRKRTVLLEAIDKIQNSLEVIENEFESKSIKIVFQDSERSYNNVSISNSELIKAFCKMLLTTAKNRIKEIEAELIK